MATKKSTFFLSIVVRSEDDDIKGPILVLTRYPFRGTFEGARRKVVRILHNAPGILQEAVIESMRDGIATTHFVEEYRYKPFEYTGTYNMKS